MNVFPQKSEFCELARQGNLVPVYTDLMADFETPVSVYAKLRTKGPAFLLESIEGGAHVHRNSFIGCQPRKIFKACRENIEVIDRDGETNIMPTPADPLSAIEEEMRRYEPVRLEGMPRFILSGGTKPASSYFNIMKYLIAIIQPHKLDAVRESLSEAGVQGLTVSEVRGFGRQKGHTEIYRGAEYTVDFLPKIKIEIAVAGDMADKVVETIQNTANTGKIGDGKIFVLDLVQAIRIRTGETDANAL